MNKLYWTGVGHVVLEAIWTNVKKFISEALEHNGYYDIDYDYFWDQIVNEEMQLWAVYSEEEGLEGILITRLMEFMGQHVCEIPICGGCSHKYWEFFMLEVIEPWCKEHKIDRIEFRTRKASSRILAKHGYHVLDVTLNKQLIRQGH